MSKTSWAINYFSFYIIWCLCIWGAAHDRATIPLCVFAFYLVLHFLLTSQTPLKELLLMLIISTLGCLNESILAYSNAVSYASASFLGVAWWTLSIYGCYATTLWYSFSWLIHRPLLGSILSVATMPLCYLGMTHAHAVALPSGMAVGLIMVGIQFAILTPIFCYIAVRMQESRWGYDEENDV
jgi:hypothetical protein